MQDLIKTAKRFAYEECRKTSMPSKGHVDFSYEVAIRLAKELKANVDIVKVGTLLMDSLIGQAFNEGRIQDHVKMSLEKAKEILDGFDIEDSVKHNIIACVNEHHGVNEFYSIESEICCNADCYRFSSIKGFSLALMNPVGMSLPQLVDLLKKKADEKWNALTLDICKEELESQYSLLMKYFTYL